MGFHQPLHASDLAQRDQLLAKLALKLGLAVAFVALLPYLFAIGIVPDGARYLGTPFNTDDHMVYAAWMRQAQEGRFFFDNRFTLDSQPELTVHLYFWLLGVISKFTGIVEATTMSRAGFSFAFVLLAWQLLKRTPLNVFTCKLALVFTCFSGGLGFLVWHNYGRVLVRPLTQPFGLLFGYHLPIDVWQPEAFVFPSMLTNGLFMVSLCLILVVILAVIDARESWKPVLWGAPAFGILMNVHSYDVLLIGLVLVGFLAACLYQKLFTGIWLLRVLAITAGILPAAFWFIRILGQDAVFQARAATPTYTAGFPTIIGGLAPALVLIGIAIWNHPEKAKSARVAVAIWFGSLLVLGLIAYGTRDAYSLNWLSWTAAFSSAIAVCVLASRKDLIWNLLIAWCAVGIVAPYIPTLFQRKLAAGIAIPFAILAAVGLAELMRRFERNQRNMVAGIFVVLMCSTSLLWFRREFELIRDNVSTTTVQPATIAKDANAIVKLLNDDPNPRKVVLAVPGVPNPGPGIDRFGYPLIPDLNPILSGLGGAYTYAGHWSETPQYAEKRNRTLRELFAASSDPAARRALVDELQADYIVTINPESYPDSPYADLSELGEIALTGNQFLVIRVR